MIFSKITKINPKYFKNGQTPDMKKVVIIKAANGKVYDHQDKSNLILKNKSIKESNKIKKKNAEQ